MKGARAASELAVVFPGQGSQRVGMGRALCERFALARRTFEEADAALGFPLSRLCFEGPEAELRLTERTQPAILTASVAAWRVLAAETGLAPRWFAGHSLGEWTALVAAGALDFAEAVRLVQARGRFMQEAVPVGSGAMAAVLGLDAAAVEA
ncbi:MAG TPA: acyltransferase domain-containing protein, partial [Thermodesulfobacteriota bacterium]|nr:acyltransferase domain-containing protein [Thermodesulfobacteriota bacterium]